MRLVSTERGLRRPPCYFTVRLVLPLLAPPSTFFHAGVFSIQTRAPSLAPLPSAPSPSGSFCPRAVSDFLTGQVCTCSPSAAAPLVSLSTRFLARPSLLLLLPYSFPRNLRLTLTHRSIPPTGVTRRKFIRDGYPRSFSPLRCAFGRR